MGRFCSVHQSSFTLQQPISWWKIILLFIYLFLVEWGTGEELLHIWYIFCHWCEANGRWGNCDWKYAEIIRGSEAQVGGKFGQSLWLWSWPVVPGRNHQWDYKAGKYLVLHVIILLDIQTKGVGHVVSECRQGKKKLYLGDDLCLGGLTGVCCATESWNRFTTWDRKTK